MPTTKLPAPPPLVKMVASISVWWTLNVSIIICNKYVFKIYGLHTPIALSCLHLAMASLCSVILLDVIKLVPKVPVNNENLLRRILPVALTFALSLALGNISLRYVPVSFMQTVKCFVPVSTAIMQYFFLGRSISRIQCIALIPVVTGVAATSITELSFVMAGFVAALADCFITSYKVILQERVLQGALKLDSFNLLYYMAPLAALPLVPLVLWMEGAVLAAYFSTPANPRAAAAIMSMSSAVLAFVLNLAIFFVIQFSSGLTFNVLGNLKVAVAILVSWLIFRNPMSLGNVVGCAVTVIGVTLYGYVSQMPSPPAVEKQTQDTEESKSLLHAPLDVEQGLPAGKGKGKGKGVDDKDEQS